jgi:hypothetical protein
MATLVPYLWRTAACKGQPLLQLQARQSGITHNLPPGTVFVELEGVQAQACMLIADYKVEQQVLLCADRQQGA